MQLKVVDVVPAGTKLQEKIENHCKQQKDGVLLSTRKMAQDMKRTTGTILINLSPSVLSKHSAIMRGSKIMRVFGNAKTIAMLTKEQSCS